MSTFESFLQTAQILANTEVSADITAIGQLNDKTALQTVATMATVNARQAAYLNLIQGGVFSVAGTPATTTASTSAIVPGVSASPFGTSFDTALSTSEVLSIYQPYFGSCPTPLPQDTSIATVTPNNTTIAQSSASLSATVSPQIGTPATIQYRVAPGGKVPAILQNQNSTQAVVQFVNGEGTYLLQLVVSDASGKTYITPIVLNYKASSSTPSTTTPTTP